MVSTVIVAACYSPSSGQNVYRTTSVITRAWQEPSSSKTQLIITEIAAYKYHIYEQQQALVTKQVNTPLVHRNFCWLFMLIGGMVEVGTA